MASNKDLFLTDEMLMFTAIENVNIDDLQLVSAVERNSGWTSAQDRRELEP